MGGFFRPGDPIRDGDGSVLSTVSQVLHTGRGYSGVLLSIRDGATYGLWLVDAAGKPRATMTTGDKIAAQGAFEARVIGALRVRPDDGN